MSARYSNDSFETQFELNLEYRVQKALVEVRYLSAKALAKLCFRSGESDWHICLRRVGLEIHTHYYSGDSKYMDGWYCLPGSALMFGFRDNRVACCEMRLLPETGI